jgi:hypothetical protein
LKDYLLLGTHGSAAYRLDTTSIVDDRGVGIKHTAGKVTPGLIKQWALNQHYDIYSQLALGARYIHLEVAVYKGEWVTIHSYLAGPLSEDMGQVASFLEHTIDGFAIVHLQRFGEETKDKSGLSHVDYLRKLYPQYIVDSGVTTNTRINTLAKKMVILGVNMKSEMYPRDYTTDLATFDLNRTVQRVQDNPPQYHEHIDTLIGFQWVMTPGTGDLVGAAMNPFRKSGLFDLVTVTDKTKLREYIHTTAYSIMPVFNIFIVDHLDTQTCTIEEEYNATI